MIFSQRNITYYVIIYKSLWRRWLYMIILSNVHGVIYKPNISYYDFVDVVLFLKNNVYDNNRN